MPAPLLPGGTPLRKNAADNENPLAAWQGHLAYSISLLTFLASQNVRARA